VIDEIKHISFSLFRLEFRSPELLTRTQTSSFSTIHFLHVDAYVGKSILENCLLTGPLADRTRILIVLDKTDSIYVMDDGIIIEQGTYEVSTGIPYISTI
jgi:hypothetical protein